MILKMVGDKKSGLVINTSARTQTRKDEK